MYIDQGSRGSRITYLRVDLLGPKLVVWREEAGWWCLSAFLTRRVIPPSLAGMTPMAYSNNQYHVPVSLRVALGAFVAGGIRTLLAMEPSFCAQLVGCLQDSLPLPITYLAAVHSPQVKRVARELHTIRPLDERRAASLCISSIPLLSPRTHLPTHW
jgi:hypothetical protein